MVMNVGRAGDKTYNLLLRNLKRFIFSMEEAAQSNTFIPSTLPKKKIKLFFFIELIAFILWLKGIDEIKKYYNSIPFITN